MAWLNVTPFSKDQLNQPIAPATIRLTDRKKVFLSFLLQNYLYKNVFMLNTLTISGL